MTKITILTPEELQPRHQYVRLGRPRTPERQQKVSEYVQAMRGIELGYGADVILDDREDKRQERENIKAAASQLNLKVEFRPAKERRIHFRVVGTGVV